MSYTPLSKNGVDRAEPLEFTTRQPARQELTLMVRARFNGFDTEITFCGQVEQLEAITKRLIALGAEPTRNQETYKDNKSTGNGYRTGNASTVSYADDGSPLCSNANCSRVGKPLEPSQHGSGYFCKGKDSRTGNSKGYCKSTAD